MGKLGEPTAAAPVRSECQPLRESRVHRQVHFPNLSSGTEQLLRSNQGKECPTPVQTLNISYSRRSLRMELSVRTSLALNSHLPLKSSWEISVKLPEDLIHQVWLGQESDCF